MTWRDVDFRNSVVRVTAKPIWRFKPKNYEERAVPVPAAMIEQLQRVEGAAQRDAGGADLSEHQGKAKQSPHRSRESRSRIGPNSIAANA